MGSPATPLAFPSTGYMRLGPYKTEEAKNVVVLSTKGKGFSTLYTGEFFLFSGVISGGSSCASFCAQSGFDYLKPRQRQGLSADEASDSLSQSHTAQ